MTYNAGHGDLRLEGDYVKLEEGGGGDGGAQCQKETSLSSGGGGGGGCWSLWWWAKLGLVLLFVGLLGAVFLKWIGPFLMDKVTFLLNYTNLWFFLFFFFLIKL